MKPYHRQTLGIGFFFSQHKSLKIHLTCIYQYFPGGSDGKEASCNVGDLVQCLGQEDPLEKGMATHSSIPAWTSPWTEEPGMPQSAGTQRARQD